MQIKEDVLAAIGNTPLIKLRTASELTGCAILGKAEFMNPGQSVKDRAALFIIEDAIAKGTLQARRHHRRGHGRQHRHRPGHGRQCHGLQDGDRHPGDPEPGEEGRPAPARRRARRGAGGALQEPEQLREIFRPARRSAGADRARTAPSGPTSSTTSPTAARHHRDHRRRRSGPQTDGKVDGFVCAVGSGGTLGGVSDGLKAKNKPNSSSALPIRMGAALYSYYTTGELKAEGSSITEGIGQGRITKNLEGAIVDDAYRIPDSEAIADRLRSPRARRPVPRRLVRHQCRRRHPARQGARPRPHHRDDALRLRHPLPVQAVQPCLPALEESCPCRPGSSAGAATCRSSSKRCQS